jgi:hypothetical protein
MGNPAVKKKKCRQPDKQNKIPVPARFPAIKNPCKI